MKSSTGSIPYKVCFTAILLFQIACSDTNSDLIDLRKENWLLCKGFVTPPVPKGVECKPATLPILPNKIFPTEERGELRRFTALVQISDAEKLRRMKNPALFLAGVGESWAAYVDNQLITNQLADVSDGRLAIINHSRGKLLPLQANWLQKSIHLYIHLEGYSPSSSIAPNFVFGLSPGYDFYLGPQASLENKRQDYWVFVLSGIYLALGAFQLMIFVRLRSELHNLFFALFSIGLAVYVVCLTPTTFRIETDFKRLATLGYAVQPLLACLFLAFLRSFFSFNSRFTFSRILYAANLLFSLSFLLLPYLYFQTVLILWYAVAVPTVLYCGSLVISAALQKKEDARRMIIAVLIAGCLAIWDILDTAILFTQVRLFKYAHLVLMMPIGVALANRFVNSFRDSARLNRELAANILELEQTKLTAVENSRRYMRIVEESPDIAFLMDHDFQILVMSRAVHRIMGYEPKECVGKDFRSLLLRGQKQDLIQTEMILRELSDLGSEKKRTRFEIQWHTPLGEGRNLKFTFDWLDDTLGNGLILGKAWPSSEDDLLPCLETDRQSLTISNDINLANAAAERLTRNLPRYVDIQTATDLRLGLFEFLINAIEHGNLNISFDEKSTALASKEGYLSYFMRKKKGETQRTKVRIIYSLSATRLRYIIADEGKGFDFPYYLENRGLQRANEGELSHGRGITVGAAIFDKVVYRRGGNTVILTKYLKSNPLKPKTKPKSKKKKK